MQELGKALVVIGFVTVLIGATLWSGRTLPIGKLPGDIAYQSNGFSFYFPIATCIVASILLTIIGWVVRAFMK